jgi:hypothetical protein
MTENFVIPTKIDKIVEENSLLILLESKVIIKNNNDRIAIYLHQISNVRLVRNRDYRQSFLVLVFLILFYKLDLIPVNSCFDFSFLYLCLIPILFGISFSIKNYTHKLLINKGKFNFNEITVSKSNSIHAENFVEKFKKQKYNNNK